MKTFILLFESRDQKGIVAKISDFIYKRGGNIVAADQYSTDFKNGHFFMRVEFVFEANKPDRSILSSEFRAIAGKFNAKWSIYDKSRILRMGILVSKPDHCLLELLYLWKAGDLGVNIPFIISNFAGHKSLAARYKIPFHYLAATKKDRKEAKILSLVKDSTDFLALARYMLVLSPVFLKKYSKDIINIHHGFLPSFKGPDPYRRALESGVKVIGATAHFATEKLDEGPIISQSVEAITHKENLESLVRKGKNLEKHALSNAVRNYIDYRVIKYNNKTIVF